ncbi:MAG: glucose-6-phosphate dehydrogenase, partial [Chloroflexi bacterium]|nr:glucose-6-phosphate dehydrogenase [Chloroflexota bacterium]
MLQRSEPTYIVIVGASGDLTQRKLVPALHSLACEGLLDQGTRIVGLARSRLDLDAFRDQLYQGVQSYARLKPTMCERWPQFANRISYLAGDYD